MFSITIRKNVLNVPAELYNSVSIIHHLKASTRAQHQSYLLLFNSSDLLIPKVQLMDNSLHLWVKNNQYLESFTVCLCSLYEPTEQVQKRRWGLWVEEGNWQSKTDDWQVGSTLSQQGKWFKSSAMLWTLCLHKAHDMAIYHSDLSLQTHTI